MRSTIAALQIRLLVLAVAVIAADLIWLALGHFHIDAAAYLRLTALGLGLLGLGWFYQARRREPGLAAMALGAGFLILFSMAASVLNYLLLTVAGRRIDDTLAVIDRHLGFNWAVTMAAMADHPRLNLLFFAVYNAALPEIALVLVALAWRGRIESAYRYCLAIGIGALIAIAVWTVHPSFGAESVYGLSPAAARLPLSVDGAYGRALVDLLRNGPGFITPADVRGLIGFPSYHGVLALIMAFHAWPLPRLRWPLLLLNAGVIIASPVQGGHHMVDLIASVPVAALALWLAGSLPPRTAELPVMVNAIRKFAPISAAQTAFRISAEQKRVSARIGD